MLIGLTGNFGSGKTTAAKMFAGLGAYIIDADKVYHALIRRGAPSYKKIVQAFGAGILKKDRTIDRKKLADVVFSNRQKLKLLNQITHRAILKEIKSIAQTKNKNIVIVEGALIVESGFSKELKALIVVKNKPEIMIDRLAKSKKLSREEIQKRLSAQMALRKKIERADFIIDNGGTRTETFSQVKKIWKRIGGYYACHK